MSLAIGLGGSAFAPLVYSHESRVMWWGNQTGFGPNQVSAAAFPQSGAGQVVRAVRGDVFIVPTESWAIGQGRMVNLRIAPFLTDPQTGDGIVPANYNMSLPGASNEDGPYIFADDRFLWEHRLARTFDATAAATPVWKVHVNWSGRVMLENNEMLAMYIENEGMSGVFGGNTISMFIYLRALCEVAD